MMTKMAKVLLLAVLVIAGKTTFAQFVYPYKEVKLITPADYKDAIPVALNAANYILSPFKENDKDRKDAIEFLSKWLAGNKEYQFSGTATLQDIADDKDVVGLYIAAMAKFGLDNKALASNGKMMDDSAKKTVLDYCNNPANNFKLKKKYRKFLE